MRFCDHCGTNLEEPAGAALLDPPPPVTEPDPQPVTPVVVTPPPPLPVPPAAVAPPPAPAVPAAAATQQWKLACVEGFRLGKEYLLYKSEMVVGRQDPEDGIYPEIELEDQDDGYVSRRHAVIHLEGDRVLVEDLGGENGTFVNGTRLPPHKPSELIQDQVLRLGKVGLMLKPHRPVQ